MVWNNPKNGFRPQEPSRPHEESRPLTQSPAPTTSGAPSNDVLGAPKFDGRRREPAPIDLFPAAPDVSDGPYQQPSAPRMVRQIVATTDFAEPAVIHRTRPAATQENTEAIPEAADDARGGGGAGVGRASLDGCVGLCSGASSMLLRRARRGRGRGRSSAISSTDPRWRLRGRPLSLAAEVRIVRIQSPPSRVLSAAGRAAPSTWRLR